MSPNNADRMANSVDRDQTAPLGDVGSAHIHFSLFQMDGLQMEGQNLNPDHVQLARILTEIDQGILKQSLSLLG